MGDYIGPLSGKPGVQNENKKETPTPHHIHHREALHPHDYTHCKSEKLKIDNFTYLTIAI